MELVLKEKVGYKESVLSNAFAVAKTDEQKLVELAKTDTEAFGELYDLFFPKVYAFVAAKVDSKSDAEDVVSNAFLKVLNALPKYQDTGAPFAAWLFKICRNEIYDYYKKSGKHKHGDLNEALEVKDQDEDLEPEKVVKKGELKSRVKEVMAQLPEREASIMHLKFFSGLNNREIANTLDLSESNVGIILFRTLKKIKPDLINLA